MLILDMFNFIQLSPQNIDQYDLCCVKSKKHQGVTQKKEWLLKAFELGYECHVLWSEELKQSIALIEFAPESASWRQIDAPHFLVIQCLIHKQKDNCGLGIGSALIQKAVARAKELKLDGVVSLTSSTESWIPEGRIFQNNGFTLGHQAYGFELHYLLLNPKVLPPTIKNHDKQMTTYKGLHLLYSPQCPMHQKCAEELAAEAKRLGLKLTVKELKEPDQANIIPSPFGTFALIHNGKVLSHHYISVRRFQNILAEEDI